MSTTGDIATVLMDHAVYHDVDRVTTVLVYADRPLPPAVVGFADRAMNRTLGPMACLADGYQLKADDAHIVETMVHRLALTSRDDVRDTVLRLLLARYADPATYQILIADTTSVDGACCDEAFLQLCLPMRRQSVTKRHRGRLS